MTFYCFRLLFLKILSKIYGLFWRCECDKGLPRLQVYMIQLMIKMLQRSQRIYFEIVQLKEKLITAQRDAAVHDENNIQTFSSLHWCAPYHPCNKNMFLSSTQKIHVKISSLCAYIVDVTTLKVCFVLQKSLVKYN